MFRYLFLFLITMFAATNAISLVEDQQQLKYDIAERGNLIEWVSHNNKKLSNDKAAKIVDAVTFHSQQNAIDPYLIFSMIRAESSYQPQATSSVGAKGLMQVWPKWHKDKLRGRDPYSIAVNVEVGVRIIDACVDKSYGNIYKALKCYSGGAGKHYQNKIAKTHMELKEQSRVIAILNNVANAPKYVFEKPRVRLPSRNEDVLLAFIQRIRS